MKFPSQNPFVILIDAYRYKKNRLGIIIDDRKITVTDKMCEAITSAMAPMEEGARLQNEAEAGAATKVHRIKIWLATKLGLVTWAMQPNIATYWNAKIFTGRGKHKGKKCLTKTFASYYHYLLRWKCR